MVVTEQVVANRVVWRVWGVAGLPVSQPAVNVAGERSILKWCVHLLHVDAGGGAVPPQKALRKKPPKKRFLLGKSKTQYISTHTPFFDAFRLTSAPLASLPFTPISDMVVWRGSSEQTLWDACTDGSVGRLKGVLPTVDVDSFNANGLAAVHLVVKHGWPELLDVLLDAEVDVLLLSRKGIGRDQLEGYTATHLAAMLPGRTDCLLTLLRRGGGTLFARSSHGWTPLHCASFAGRYESLRILLEHDAEPDCQAHDGRSPLMMAAGMTMVRAVRLLLGASAKVHLTDSNGSTALHYALDTKSQKLLRGRVPLKPEHYETAYLLTLAGCDLEAVSLQGIKALDFVAPQWQHFFTTVHTHRAALLRGGVLPFAESHHGDVPCGLTFAELLGAEATTLLSVGLPAAVVSEWQPTLRIVHSEVHRSAGGDDSTASPRRRFGRPSPPAATPPPKGWYQQALHSARTIATCAFALFFLWAGVLTERYSHDSTLLYIFTQLFYDPFYEAVS